MSKAIALLTIALLVFTSCSRNNKQYTDAVTNRDSVPGLTTYDIETLISDSGVVRYRILADRWDVYDQLKPSKWAFEEGVYLEKFSDSLTINATVRADTAYYYDQSKLWELYGSVHIENLEGEIFDTDTLFWNQDTERVWSDAYIRIEKANGTVVTGYGFTSNQQFTDYRIRRTQGIFPIEENDRATRNAAGEIVADSTNVI
ncbi:MAG: LPS export ABC transporter periplasmic protein LptC [Bacteroidaceae bacterium]|nr:LPS export ABC transporter periplasmic protein LptC [Bacteroidaceae bacterium]MBR4337558.1 LPS export ABC transporter periplasmic protein LptC [Bacteroidaceae bacterium]